MREGDHEGAASGAMESVRNTMVFSSRDWSRGAEDAWLYGILVGWDLPSLENLRRRHKWDRETIHRLQRLREEYATAGPCAHARAVACPMLKVAIQLLHPNAILPKYQTPGSAGADLHCLTDFTVEADVIRVRTGIAIELPPGYEAQIRPRSSVSGKGILVHPGTIDSDYRGEIQVQLQRVAPSEPYSFKAGDRIAQLVIAPVAQADFHLQELNPTTRGSGGFGSTGA